jgi:hypothetical protein
MPSTAPRLALAAAAIFSFAGCEREAIQVYTAPKDQPAAEEHYPGDGHDHGTAGTQPTERPALPKFTWTLPEGWSEAPASQMSAANFSVKGDEGEVGVTVTPLPDLGGQEELVVNMWRQQVGEEPLSAEQVKQALTEVEIAGSKGQLFEIGGTRDGKPLKIVTAMLHGQAGASWFFKMSGDAAAVEKQRSAFLDFVKSVKFEAAPSAPTAAATAAAPASAPTSGAPAATPTPSAAAEPSQQFKWTVPEGWETLAPGQMQVAKFKVPEKEGANAEVAVSVFPSDTGGTLSNVNRWLGQLGKSPLEESALGTVVKPLEGGPEGAELVDLSGDDKKMLGAIVPRDGRWWFYKMTGGPAAVNAARDAFVAFAKAQP